MICFVCTVDQPEGEFYIRSGSVRRRDCKRCVRGRIAAHRQAHLKEYRQRDAERYRMPERRAQYATQQERARKRIYNKRYFAEHGVEVRRRQGRQQRALYAAERRARLRGNGVYVVTTRDLRRLVARWRGLCAYCQVDPWEHMDHVLPISRGGRHSIGNLLPACAACNFRKSARLLAAFLAEAG